MTTLVSVQYAGQNKDSKCLFSNQKLICKNYCQNLSGGDATDKINNYVVVATDTQSTSGYRGLKSLNGKVAFIANGQILIATTGLARIGEVLDTAKYTHLDGFRPEMLMAFKNGKKIHYADLTRSEQAVVVRKFITDYVSTGIKDALKKYESVKEDKDTYPMEGGCIVAMCGFAFELDGCYYSARHEDPYCAKGSGGSYAIGSLRRGIQFNETKHVDPKYEAAYAVRVAIESDVYSGGKVEVYVMCEEEGFVEYQVYDQQMRLLDSEQKNQFRSVDPTIQLSYNKNYFDSGKSSIVLPKSSEIAQVTSSKGKGACMPFELAKP